MIVDGSVLARLRSKSGLRDGFVLGWIWVFLSAAQTERVSLLQPSGPTRTHESHEKTVAQLPFIF